jgi:hypothetical protein
MSRRNLSRGIGARCLWFGWCGAARAPRGRKPEVGEQNFSHGRKKISAAESARQPEANESERLAAARTEGNASSQVTSARGGLSAERGGRRRARARFFATQVRAGLGLQAIGVESR